MHSSKQKDVDELYRLKDIAPAIIGIITVIICGVLFARFVTSYAGL